MQLEVKTILNRIQRFAGFVYKDIRFRCRLPGRLRIEVSIESHRHVRGKCSRCQQPAPTYDHLPERSWLYGNRPAEPSYGEGGVRGRMAG